MTTDDSIRSVQRAIRELEKAVDSARGDMKTAMVRKKEYERRLCELTSINSRLHGMVSNSSAECGSAQRLCNSRLWAATRGLGRAPGLMDSLVRAVEVPVESDDRVCEIDTDIRREIDRCRQEIEAAAAAYLIASVAEQRACDSRSYYVGRARELAVSPDATVQVWESSRY